MKLTPELKASIDALSYEELLREWRFAPSGSPKFQDETGAYWLKRMSELRNQPGGHEEAVRASKSIGW